MKKIYKIANIALIFMLGAVVCSNFGYASPEFTLRPILKYSSETKKDASKKFHDVSNSLEEAGNNLKLEVGKKQGFVTPKFYDLSSSKNRLNEIRAYLGNLSGKKLNVNEIIQVIDKDEFEFLARGVEQRGRALVRFLQDIYSRRWEVIEKGIIPENVVIKALKTQGYEELVGMLPASAVAITYGPDLNYNQRCVIEDNIGGIGGKEDIFSNIKALHRVFPELRVIDPKRLRKIFIEDLKSVVPSQGQAIAYWEDPAFSEFHTFPLDRDELESLGIFFIGNVTEEKDRVKIDGDRGLFIVTPEGEEIKVGYLSFNEYDYTLDPRISYFRERMEDLGHSPISEGLDGVFGLVNLEKLILSTSMGASLADSKLIYPFVEKFIEFYLKEEPILRSTKVFALNHDYGLETLEFDKALERKDDLVIKPIRGEGGKDVVVGRSVDVPMWRQKLKSAFESPDDFLLFEYSEPPHIKDYITRHRLIAEVMPDLDTVIYPGVYVTAKHELEDGVIGFERPGTSSMIALIKGVSVPDENGKISITCKNIISSGRKTPSEIKAGEEQVFNEVLKDFIVYLCGGMPENLKEKSRLLSDSVYIEIDEYLERAGFTGDIDPYADRLMSRMEKTLTGKLKRFRTDWGKKYHFWSAILSIEVEGGEKKGKDFIELIRKTLKYAIDQDYDFLREEKVNDIPVIEVIEYFFKSGEEKRKELNTLLDYAKEHIDREDGQKALNEVLGKLKILKDIPGTPDFVIVHEYEKKAYNVGLFAPGRAKKEADEILEIAEKKVREEIEAEREGKAGFLRAEPETVVDLFKLHKAMTTRDEERLFDLPREVEANLTQEEIDFFYAQRRDIINLIDLRLIQRKKMIREGKAGELGKLSNEETFINLTENILPDLKEGLRKALDGKNLNDFIRTRNRLSDIPDDLFGRYKKKYTDIINPLSASFDKEAESIFSDNEVIREIKEALENPEKTLIVTVEGIMNRRKLKRKEDLYSMRDVREDTRRARSDDVIIVECSGIMGWAGTMADVDSNRFRRMIGKQYNASIVACEWEGIIPFPKFSLRETERAIPEELRIAIENGSTVKAIVEKIAYVKHDPWDLDWGSELKPCGFHVGWIGSKGTSVSGFVPLREIPRTIPKEKMENYAFEEIEVVPFLDKNDEGEEEIRFSIRRAQAMADKAIYEELRERQKGRERVRVEIVDIGFSGEEPTGFVVNYEGVEGFIHARNTDIDFSSVSVEELRLHIGKTVDATISYPGEAEGRLPKFSMVITDETTDGFTYSPFEGLADLLDKSKKGKKGKDTSS